MVGKVAGQPIGKLSVRYSMSILQFEPDLLTRTQGPLGVCFHGRYHSSRADPGWRIALALEQGEVHSEVIFIIALALAFGKRLGQLCYGGYDFS